MGKLKDLVIKVEGEETFTTEEYSVYTNLTFNKAKTELKELLALGSVERIDDGKWRFRKKS